MTDHIHLILQGLRPLYPDTRTPLLHADAFQLLIATILSAQTTDIQVNRVTPDLFRRFPDASSLSRAPVEEVAAIIQSVGLHHGKARNVCACAVQLLERFDDQVPSSIEELASLPGVGRKTANVVAGQYFGLPAVFVDTHVGRVARRLGLTSHSDPVKVERELRAILADGIKTEFASLLFLHGGAVCHARRPPECAGCPLNDFCPSSEASLTNPETGR